jgi:hypothetical protein
MVANYSYDDYDHHSQLLEIPIAAAEKNLHLDSMHGLYHAVFVS